MVFWKEINGNIIIVTTVLICASLFVLCFHGVEQLEADCFKNEPYLRGKPPFKPMAWFNSARSINPSCSSQVFVLLWVFFFLISNPRHHFLLHITIREERQRRSSRTTQASLQQSLLFTSFCEWARRSYKVWNPWTHGSSSGDRDNKVFRNSSRFLQAFIPMSLLIQSIGLDVRKLQATIFPSIVGLDSL